MRYACEIGFPDKAPWADPLPRLHICQALGLRQSIWLILRNGALYEERGPAVTTLSKYKRTWKMIRQLRQLRYRIESPNPQPSQAQA